MITAALLAGGWLVLDFGTFGLVQGSPDRADGCYTDLEMLIGAKSASPWTRAAEFWVGAALIIVGSYGAVTHIRAWWRDDRNGVSNARRPDG